MVERYSDLVARFDRTRYSRSDGIIASSEKKDVIERVKAAQSALGYSKYVYGTRAYNEWYRLDDFAKFLDSRNHYDVRSASYKNVSRQFGSDVAKYVDGTGWRGKTDFNITRHEANAYVEKCKREVDLRKKLLDEEVRKLDQDSTLSARHAVKDAKAMLAWAQRRLAQAKNV